MEEKIVGEKKGSSLFSDISFTLLSIASLSSVFIYTAPALPVPVDLPPHSGSPTISQHPSMKWCRLGYVSGCQRLVRSGEFNAPS